MLKANEDWKRRLRVCDVVTVADDRYPMLHGSEELRLAAGSEAEVRGVRIDGTYVMDSDWGRFIARPEQVVAMPD